MNPRKYKPLVQDFLTREISVESFVQTYQKMFLDEDEPILKEPNATETEIFWILEKIFEATESYYPDCAVGEETRYVISEQRLREEISEQLANLEKYL